MFENFQTTYGYMPEVGMPGTPATSNPRPFIDSMIAQEIIPLGAAVVRTLGTASANKVRLPVVNKIVITDDGGTWTAGNCTITVNGFTFTVTYDTDKATMMAKLVGALGFLQCAEISTATYDGAAHTITLIAASNVNLVATLDITGRTGNMTISSTVSYCTETILGIAAFHPELERGYVGQVINDKAVLALTGDTLTTSDTLTATVNGVVQTVVTYNGVSEASTLNVFGALLASITGIYSVAVDTTARTITVLANYGLPLSISVAVHDNNLSSVAPAISATMSSQNTAAGDVYFTPGQLVPVAPVGDWNIPVEAAVTPDSTLYVRFKSHGANTQRGAISGTADAGYNVAASGWSFRNTAAAAAISVVRIGV